jgi:hypothetical protein
MMQAVDPYEQFERDIEPITSDKPAGPLFHYTSSAGIINILKTGKVWATHCRHLNDTSEIIVGSLLISEVARALRDDSSVGAARQSLFRDLSSHLEQFPLHEWFKPYIASFSEVGDQLSQWREYGDGASGYSLGLDLPEHFDGQPGLTGRLVRCEYGPDAFRQRVRSIFLDVAQKLEDYVRAGYDLHRLVLIALRFLMLHSSTLVPRLKSAGFAEEREWRIVVFANSEEDEVRLAEFRPGRRGVTPYFEIALTGDDGLMPLAKVFVGPTADADAGVEAAILMLRKNRYGNALALVERSPIPYRAR